MVRYSLLPHLDQLSFSFFNHSSICIYPSLTSAMFVSKNLFDRMYFKIMPSKAAKRIQMAMLLCVVVLVFQPPWPSIKSFNVSFNAVLEPKMCQQKYILLSLQQSGSSWVGSLLDAQDSVTCGIQEEGSGYKYTYDERYELLIQYSETRKSYDPAKVEWDSYETSLDDAFSKMCHKYPAPVVGFKLMYNQVPRQFLRNGQFHNYLKENKVSIIHLVRESAAMKIASQENSRQQQMSTATDAAVAKDLRIAPKLPYNDFTVDHIKGLERESESWQRIIHFMYAVRDLRVSYENLLLENSRRDQLVQIMTFLQPVSTSSQVYHSFTVKIDSNLQKLHAAACSDRIEDYDKFVTDERVVVTRTFAACQMIEASYNDRDNNQMEKVSF